MFGKDNGTVGVLWRAIKQRKVIEDMLAVTINDSKTPPSSARAVHNLEASHLQYPCYKACQILWNVDVNASKKEIRPPPLSQPSSQTNLVDIYTQTLWLTARLLAVSAFLLNPNFPLQVTILVMAMFEINTQISKALQNCFENPLHPAKFEYSHDFSNILKDLAANNLADAIDSLEIVHRDDLKQLELRSTQLELLHTFLEKNHTFTNTQTRLPYIVMATVSPMDDNKFCITVITNNIKLPYITLDVISSFSEIISGLRSIKIDGLSLEKSSSAEVVHRPNNVSHIDIHIGGDVTENTGLLDYVLHVYHKNLESLRITADPDVRQPEKREKLYKYHYQLQRLKKIEITEYPISVTRLLKALYASHCRPTHVTLDVQKQPEKLFHYLSQIGATTLQLLSLSMSTIPNIEDLEVYKNLQNLAIIYNGKEQKCDIKYFQRVLKKLTSFTFGYGKNNAAHIDFNLPDDEMYPYLKELTFVNTILKGDQLNGCQTQFPNLTTIRLNNCQISENTKLDLSDCELETLALSNWRHYSKIEVNITDEDTVYKAQVSKNSKIRETGPNQFIYQNQAVEMNGDKLEIIVKKIQNIQLKNEVTTLLRFMSTEMDTDKDEDFISAADGEEEQDSFQKDEQVKKGSKQAELNDRDNKDDNNDGEFSLSDNEDTADSPVEEGKQTIENNSGISDRQEAPLEDTSENEGNQGNNVNNDNGSFSKEGYNDAVNADADMEEEEAIEEEYKELVIEKTEKEEATYENYEFDDEESGEEADASYDENERSITTRQSLKESTVSSNIRTKRRKIHFLQDQSSTDDFMYNLKHYKAVIRISY